MSQVRAIFGFEPLKVRQTIETIPGDTIESKLAWVQQAKAGIYTCVCFGNCDSGADTAARAMAKALGEIEAVINDWGKADKQVSFNDITTQSLLKISMIVGKVE